MTQNVVARCVGVSKLLPVQYMPYCTLVQYIYIALPLVQYIMEYGSTPYIGMAPKKNGCPIVCVQSDMFKPLP